MASFIAGLCLLSVSDPSGVKNTIGLVPFCCGGKRCARTSVALWLSVPGSERSLSVGEPNTRTPAERPTATRIHGMTINHAWCAQSRPSFCMASDITAGVPRSARGHRRPLIEWNCDYSPLVIRRPTPLKKKDAAAGLLLGLSNVPGGLAMGLLAGVSPISGLYAYLFGTVAGAIATSSVLMSVQGTAALAVLVSDVPGVDASAAGLTALVTLTVLTGVIMLALGLARTGTVVRFVPHSVVTGFVNAVAVTIVLSQLAEFTGYRSPQDNRVARATRHRSRMWGRSTPQRWSPLVATVALIFTLGRTRLGAFGMVVAIVVVSAAVQVLGVDSVRQVSDVAEIPAGLPTPQLPDLSLVAGCFCPPCRLPSSALSRDRRSASRFRTPTATTQMSLGTFADRESPTWRPESFRGCRSVVR